MAKENKKKSGIPRLLELAGEKKTLMVWGCILSTANVFFQLVPFLAVYNIMVELLKTHLISQMQIRDLWCHGL